MAKRKKIMKTCHLDEFRKRDHPSTNMKLPMGSKVSGGRGCSHCRLPSSPHKLLTCSQKSLY